MSYLLDTNVLSELRKGTRCDVNVRHWITGVDPAECLTSVLVIGEIRRGIERLRRRDGETAKVLERWLNQVRTAFAERILPIDERIAEEWGRLGVPDPLPAIDGLLAATARTHGLTLVTRNTADMARTGVEVLDPFATD